MIDLYKLKRNERSCRSLLGYRWKEVEKLYSHFRKAEYRYRLRHPRQRKPGAGNKPKVLNTSLKRLVFILYYLRTYPTFEQLGMQFDMDRSRSWKWVQKLLPILEEALDKELPRPKRKKGIAPGSILGSLSYVIIDASEQPIRRPQKGERAFYSGKKNDIR